MQVLRKAVHQDPQQADVLFRQLQTECLEGAESKIPSKKEIKNQIRESVENAIKSAARRVVWDLYRDTDIEKMIENKILETVQKN